MNVFEFQEWVSEMLKHSIVISLRRAGFTAWLDSDGLHTNATRLGVGLTAGSGQVLGRAVSLAELTK